MKLFLLLTLAFSFSAPAAEKEKALPYLGPGADKLSKAEYERIYKNYIQTSVLLGYPFLEGSMGACEQALGSTFRQAGLFAYPVPADAPSVQRHVRGKVETYESAGVLLQLSRAANGAPLRLIWINSGAPKATRRLSQIARKEELTLEKDKITGLERVKGLPVGFPHPFLNASGQGLTVKILKFNGKKDDCLPVDFSDNSWNSGFEINNGRCQELQRDAEKVWAEEMSPGDFRDRELSRLKGNALKNAMASGVSEAEAKKLVEKHFVKPFTNEINVVGAAMRNLAQCNLMALGGKERRVAPAADPKAGGDGTPNSGSAE